MQREIQVSQFSAPSTADLLEFIIKFPTILSYAARIRICVSVSEGYMDAWIWQFSKKSDTWICFSFLFHKIKKIIIHIKTDNNKTLQST
jgi:hypothetical protein